MMPVMMDGPGLEEPRERPPAPLALPAAGLALGIALDWSMPAPLFAWLAIGVVAAIAAVTRRDRAAWLTAGLFVMSVALGVVRHQLAFNRWPSDHVSRMVPEDAVVGTLRGIIADTPETYVPSSATGPRAFVSSPRTRFVLRTENWIDTQDRTLPSSGDVVVYVTPARPELGPGDRIEVFGRIYRIPPPANPGEWDRGLALRRNGILVGLSANTFEALRVVERPSAAAPLRLLHSARRALSATLRDTGAGPAEEEVGSVLDALVLAQRSRVADSINDAYVKTGNSHLLAASGLNVAWLVLFVWLAALPARLSLRQTAVIALLVVNGYGILAEPNPPILRAVLMADLAGIAILFRRPLNTRNWLATSVIVLLLANPCMLFGAGFQLSFGVLIALLELSPTVHEAMLSGLRRALRLPQLLKTTQADDIPPAQRRKERVARAIAWVMAVPFAAWLGGLPLLVLHFGAVSPWAPFSTAVLGPFAFGVMLLGFVKLALAVVLPSTAVVTGPLLTGLTDTMNGVVEAFARLPGSFVRVGSPGPVGVAMMYAVLIAWIGWERLSEHWQALIAGRLARGGRLPAWYTNLSPRLRFAAPRLACMALYVLPLLPMPRWPWPSAERPLRVWVLAVGDGSATVIELPNGRTLLYDAGTRNNYDAAARTLLPFLRTRGITRIDAAFVSHPDLDHFSALERLVEVVPVGRLILNEHFEPFAADQRSAVIFLKKVRAAGVRIETISAGWRMPDTGAVEIRALWPPPAAAFINNDNNSSTVLRIALDGRSLLLTGDIAEYAMDQLIEAASDSADAAGLRCDAMVLPHHGGMTGSTPGFLETAGAGIVIRSSAMHDDDTVNGMIEAVADRRYYNTADAGCVEVRWAAGKLAIETMRGSNTAAHAGRR